MPGRCDDSATSTKGTPGKRPGQAGRRVQAEAKSFSWRTSCLHLYSKLGSHAMVACVGPVEQAAIAFGLVWEGRFCEGENMRYSPWFTAVAVGWACLSMQMVRTGTADDRARTPAAGKTPADVFARSNLVAWCIVPFDAKNRRPAERRDGQAARPGARGLRLARQPRRQLRGRDPAVQEARHRVLRLLGHARQGLRALRQARPASANLADGPVARRLRLQKLASPRR